MACEMTNNNLEISLFKKGKADEMDNYRPVSILPVLSKVLERAVHIQL